MSKKVILIIIIGISAFFVTMEYILNPPKTSEIKNQEQLMPDNNQNNPIADIEDIPEPIFTRFINKESFAKSEIGDVQITKIEKADNFFKRIVIDPDKDGFTAISATFEKEGVVVAKIYEFQPKTEITTAKIFSILSSKLVSSIKEDEKEFINVNQKDNFGSHSFYFNNDRDYKDMVFLVVKSADKILAFEYKKVNHDKMKNVITYYFPKNEG